MTLRAPCWGRFKGGFLRPAAIDVMRQPAPERLWRRCSCWHSGVGIGGVVALYGYPYRWTTIWPYQASGMRLAMEFDQFDDMASGKRSSYLRIGVRALLMNFEYANGKRDGCCCCCLRRYGNEANGRSAFHHTHSLTHTNKTKHRQSPPIAANSESRAPAPLRYRASALFPFAAGP